ncbi:MAG: peroxide-responsive transcriptional repressor PerR [Calditrichia bacterium]
MERRNSKKRNRLLELIKQMEHVTADDVYNVIRQEFPAISLGTVYRNLHQLAEMGEILEFNFGRGPAVFEYAAENHPHFVCESCNTIYNLEVPIESLIVRGVEKNEGHHVNHMNIIIYGTCKHCS